MLEASIKYQDKYFIAVNTDPVPGNLLTSFLEKVRLFSKRCEVHLTRSSTSDGSLDLIKDIAASYRNFRLHSIATTTPPQEEVMNNEFSRTLQQIAEPFLHSALPYLLLLDNVPQPPLSLLKKFDRAISYLEKVDSEWGILGGLYHRGFNVHSTSGNTASHVLSGCAIYKRKVIEKITDKSELSFFNSHPAVYRNEYSYYDGHSLVQQRRNTNRTKPVIVKG